MNVLLTALQAGNRSGTGVYAARLAARLPALAGDSTVTVVWPDSLPIPPLRAGAADTFRRRPARSSRARVIYDQLGIRKDVRSLRIDVVHYPANIGSVLPMRHMVITIHDLTFLHNPSWYRFERARYYRLGVTYSAPRAARIIAVSQYTANEVATLLRIPMERIDVIHNGVDERYVPCDEERVAAARATYRLPSKYFLFVGTIEPRKNVARLIRAWSQIADSIEEDLVIAGRDGWKVGPTYQEAELSKHHNRIVFPGFIADEHLSAVMSGATALVYPSLYEGFGMPVVEAMACGAPVLSSNASSLPEVAEDAALLVDPTSIEELAEGLKRLAGDEELRRSLRAAGIKRAAEFSWTRAAEETLACYRRVLES